jgi:F-type H+-transporting ATPase subunit gamma
LPHGHFIVSETLETLRSKIQGASDLQSVVRTMKAVAASGVGQYERSVKALAQYLRTVELGLGACFRDLGPTDSGQDATGPKPRAFCAIVFGSDQGLVGQFNETVADFVKKTISVMPGDPKVWAVGERVHARLADADLPPLGLYAVPGSLAAVAPLVGKIQVESEALQAKGDYAEVYVFHNRPRSGSLYEPVVQRLLPLDDRWQQGLAKVGWPTPNPPEILGGSAATLGPLVREYLFISLFQACVESLASENASRLAAMQRADRNIEELLEDLKGTFRRSRQNSIDEELFDVISGFEASAKKGRT